MWASSSAREVHEALGRGNHRLSSALVRHLDECFTQLGWGTLAECIARRSERVGPWGEAAQAAPIDPDPDPWTPEDEARFHAAYAHQDDDDPWWIEECAAVAEWLDERMERRRHENAAAGVARIEQFERGIAA